MKLFSPSDALFSQLRAYAFDLLIASEYHLKKRVNSGIILSYSNSKSETSTPPPQSLMFHGVGTELADSRVFEVGKVRDGSKLDTDLTDTDITNLYVKQN